LRHHPTILQTESLSVGYPALGDLLSGLDLRLPAGQLCCLLGANGTGKSTLLRTLSGLHQPLSGQVKLYQKPLKHYKAKQLSQYLSLVLTQQGTNQSLKVHELVAMGRYPYTPWLGSLKKDDQVFIQRAMADTGTLDLADRPLFELSDGERQKVMIARAMAQDTPLIILDEPTVHLDIPNRIDIVQLLSRLAHEHQKAVLMSSHDLELALQSADQLWLIQQDQIVSGIPEDLLLQGKINKTFSGSNIRFDPQRGNFVLKNHTRHFVRFYAEGLLGQWTQHALERCGFQVITDRHADLSVDIQQTRPTPAWILQSPSGSVLCHSLEALLKQLNLRLSAQKKKLKTEG